MNLISERFIKWYRFKKNRWLNLLKLYHYNSFISHITIYLTNYPFNIYASLLKLPSFSREACLIHSLGLVSSWGLIAEIVFYNFENKVHCVTSLAHNFWARTMKITAFSLFSQRFKRYRWEFDMPLKKLRFPGFPKRPGTQRSAVWTPSFWQLS